jgi:hypothetical protein
MVMSSDDSCACRSRELIEGGGRIVFDGQNERKALGYSRLVSISRTIGKTIRSTWITREARGRQACLLRLVSICRMDSQE